MNHDNKTFFDIHCHSFNLSHPNILAFIESLKKYGKDNFIIGLFSSSYLFESFLKKPGIKIKNMLSVMENDIGSMFMLMEDDLKGKFLKNGVKPLIQNNKLNIGNTSYSRIVLTPLIIDFGDKELQSSDIYYNAPPSKPIMEQVEDVFNGIKKYRKERPDGLLEIYPFFGMNAQNYDLKEIRKLLENFFSRYISSRLIFLEKFVSMDIFDVNIKFIGSNFFSGIKVYPPLGFDPWPKNNIKEMEKVRFLYDFCSNKRIPITTHCDDQGFCIIKAEDSQKYTSPYRWENVLKNYPDLKLNFAHLGRQYYKKFGVISQDKWRKKILELMLDYKNVYSDFSFNADKPDYYSLLIDTLNSFSENSKKILEKRILFGTDFMVNLMNVDSYFQYFDIFSNSPIDDYRKEMFCSENPSRFLFENKTPIDKIYRFFQQMKNSVNKK